MEYYITESTANPERFFRVLPADWHQGVAPYWAEYQDTARIFIAETDTEVLGGGIVFSTVSPDTHPEYVATAQRWFEEGYLYIGFLWFSESQRGKQLGTNWLKWVLKSFPDHNFWLAIDEYHLASFYSRNGFELVERIDLNDYPEWIMAWHAPKAEIAPKTVRKIMAV